MKLTLENPKLFKDTINIISELVTDATFKIGTEKIELVDMDPANVAMVLLTLHKSAFTEYDVTEEQILSVNLDNLKAILKRAKPKDNIMLSLNAETNRLNIQLGDSNKRNFNLALLDLEYTETKVPALDFNVTVKTTSQTFLDTIEDMSIVSESVQFKASDDRLFVSSTDFKTDALVVLGNDNGTEVTVTGDKAVFSKYSLEYLKKFIKCSKLSDDVTIKFSNEYPLRVNYGDGEKFELGFVLAPRVSND